MAILLKRWQILVPNCNAGHHLVVVAAAVLFVCISFLLLQP